MASFLLPDEALSSEALKLSTDKGTDLSLATYSGLSEFNDFPIERGMQRASGFSGAWMLTLTDLTMLIFAFFVLLYAMQTPISSTLKADSTTLSRNSKITLEDIVSPPDATLNAVAVAKKHLNSQNYIARILETARQNDPRLENANIRLFDKDIHISFPDQVFFNAQSIRVSQNAIPQIVALSRILSTVRNQAVVEISTHQSSSSPLTGRASTDWSMSLSQGAALARAFRIAGYRRPLAVAATFSPKPSSKKEATIQGFDTHSQFATHTQGGEKKINVTSLGSKNAIAGERAQHAAHVTIVLKPYHHESS